MKCVHRYVPAGRYLKCKKCGHMRHKKNLDKTKPQSLPYKQIGKMGKKKHGMKSAKHMPKPSDGSKKKIGSRVNYKPKPGRSSLRPMDVWLESISGLEFEDVCYAIFRRCRFATKKIGGVSDGGRDLLFWTDLGKIVVECKHQAKPIGRPVVQKLHAATITDHAVGSLLVSTGGFTPKAAKYPHTRTGSDALSAIKHMRRGDIILMDLDGLRSLARSASVMLHNGKDPATRDVNLTPLKELFSGLKSSPKTPEELVHCEVQGHSVETCWVVDVKIEQDFFSSIGRRIHRMRKKGTYACHSDGTILGGKLFKMVMSGGDAISKGGDWKAVKKSIVSDMKRKHTKKVGYRGGNGSQYVKKCEPGVKYMRFESKPIGVNQAHAEVKILRKRYKWSIPWWDEKIRCRMCKEPSKMLNQLLICNDCGAISHSKHCGGQCGKCKKTICKSCAVTQKKALQTRILCTECFV